MQAITQIDEEMMRRALELAARGRGLVSPSPLVGCIVVSSAYDVVGEGFYVHDNVRHAETIALDQAGAAARGACAYVTLEPHAHHGRTPPCTAALIAAGITRVVFPIEDPNPLVSGAGALALIDAGIEVVTGVLATEGARLNESYMHALKHGRPFVHLKLACSLDGRIATAAGESQWISGPEARARVHELRHEYDAVLIGANTARLDDPLLTDRSGRSRRRPLVRVVLDDQLSLSPNSNLAGTTVEAPVLVFTKLPVSSARAEVLSAKGVEVIGLEAGARDLVRVLAELERRSLQSVLLEGGPTVAGSFADASLIDKVTFFIAPLLIGGQGAPAALLGQGARQLSSALRLRDTGVTMRGSDVEITGYPMLHELALAGSKHEQR